MNIRNHTLKLVISAQLECSFPYLNRNIADARGSRGHDMHMIELNQYAVNF
jgi:hypothetical protein